MAHAFDWGNTEQFPNAPLHKHEVIFVPAMGPRYDYKGNLFGYYRACKLHKLDGYNACTSNEWTSDHALYDICSAHIISWGRKGEIGYIRSAIDSSEYFCRKTEMSDVEIDMQLNNSFISVKNSLKELYEMDSSSPIKRRHKIIGYAYCPANVDLKMCILYVTVRPEHNCYFAYEGAPHGMSGGPWILSTQRTQAFGIQASTTFREDKQGKKRGLRSRSPLITEGVARRLCIDL